VISIDPKLAFLSVTADLDLCPFVDDLAKTAFRTTYRIVLTLSIRRTAVVGSIYEYPTEELAHAALNGFRVRLNENRNRQGQQVILVADLVDHYIETELSDGTEWHAKSTCTIYADYLHRWVRPYWGKTNIRDVRTVAVEAWLRQLRHKDSERPLANGTKAKIRNIMSVLFNPLFGMSGLNKEEIQ